MMSVYKRILCVTSSEEDNHDVLEAANDMALQTGADVDILHTIPVIGQGLDYTLPSLGKVEEKCIKQAKARIKEDVRDHGIDNADPIVGLGDLSDLAADAANQLDVDLIVVKNDNKNVLSSAQALLGSTDRDLLFVQSDD